LDRV